MARVSGRRRRALRAFRRARTGEYRIALNTLEQSGRDETAAEVVRLRAAFQAVIDRFDENRAAFAGDESCAGLIMQIDARIVACGSIEQNIVKRCARVMTRLRNNF